MDSDHGNDSYDGVATQSRRSAAVRALGVASATLLGAIGLQSAASDARDTTPSKRRKARTEKKKSKSGPPGPAGAVGAQGPQGPQGPAGAPGQGSGVTFEFGDFEQFTAVANTTTSKTSLCPEGTIAISASYIVTDERCYATSSNQPADNAWELVIHCPNGVTSDDNTLQALCLRGLG